jgi:bifunctional DNA-binding transcriptional regulator/antitoxin component of YhaV-PrlF toxin-antitoxin module
MNKVLTITRKGQTTLPVAIRQHLGIDKNGGELYLELDETTGKVTLTRTLTVGELGDQISQYIRPKTKPILDVDSYYQEHRGTSQ